MNCVSHQVLMLHGLTVGTGYVDAVKAGRDLGPARRPRGPWPVAFTTRGGSTGGESEQTSPVTAQPEAAGGAGRCVWGPQP